MKIPDMLPSLGLLLGAVTMVTTASPAQAAKPYVLGVCRTARQSTGEEIMPTFDADIYLADYHAGDARYKNFSFATKGVNISLIKAPAHGKMTLSGDVNAASKSYYHYMPNPGYIGRDRFVMQVDKSGVKVQIEYLIEGLDNDEADVGICDSEHWKISTTTPAFGNSNLQARLNGASANNTFFVNASNFTIGNTITLNTNAAIYGWYIDYTPYLNKKLQHSRIL